MQIDTCPPRSAAARGPLAVISLISSLFVSALALPQDSQGQYQRIYDESGTVQFPAMTIPQSDFVSPEFKRAYYNHLRAAETLPAPPPMDGSAQAWAQFRAVFDQAVPNADGGHDWIVAHYPHVISKTKMGGVPVEIITPKEGIAPQNQHRVLINLHGGGFFAGGGGMTGESESIPVAVMGRIKVVTVDYRMAPEHQFPAASEDVEAVYRELMKTYKPASIGIYGCSAGGILAGQAITWLQSKNLPRPGAVGMFCMAPSEPGKMGDLAVWGINGLPPVPGAPFSLSCGRTGCNVQPKAADTPATAATTGSSRPQRAGYMANADLTDPRAYPGASDSALAKFPPSLLMTGTRTMDASMSIAAHARFLQLVSTHSCICRMADGTGFTSSPHSRLRKDSPRPSTSINSSISTWTDDAHETTRSSSDKSTVALVG